MTDEARSRSDESEPRLGGAFYDQPAVFERYQQHRRWHLNPNATLEEAAFVDELGSVAGLRVLDLGCGDARTGVALLGNGCASYHGIDGSQLMVRAACANLDGTPGTAEVCDMEDFQIRLGAFDLIVSRMALHYLANIGGLLRASYASLIPGGRLVFTVPHPVVTSNDQRASTAEPRQDWVVDNYFMEGPRRQVWLGATTVWHHRTVETYVRELRSAGFQLDNVRECPPDPSRFDDEDEFSRRRRIPLMLLVAGARSN